MLLGGYFNGNYFVSYLDRSGTSKRCLRNNETFNPDFPDTIDIKITNKCNWGCPYCHESSCPSGKTMNLENLKKVLKCLPRVGIELAIGGGNILLDYDLTKNFIIWANNYGFRTNITVSNLDIKSTFNNSNLEKEYMNLFRLVKGIGISLDHYSPDIIKFINTHHLYSSVIVLHVIVGIISIEDLNKLIGSYNTINKTKILILGFKQFGRAKDMEIPNLPEWIAGIKKIIFNIRCNNNAIISFDNLAIEQLGIKDLLLEDEWNRLYFGDEFSSSMYIDAVEETFAPTSRDPNRVNWKDSTLLEFFKNNKNDY